MIWVEVAFWLGLPVFGAVVAWRTGWPPAPVMAITAGSVIIMMALSGIIQAHLARQGVDQSSHDTYYVIAAHHYLLQYGILVVFVALPLRLIARLVPRPAHLATVMFVMLHIGTGLTLFPQRVIAATSGLPRRYPDAEGFFVLANRISHGGTTMAFIALCGITLAALVAVYRMGGWRNSR